MLDIGFPYYFFGSHNSLDVDVLVDHPETSNEAVDAIKLLHPATKDWNMSLIGIENGRIVRTMPRRGSPDAVHNSLYYTYNIHAQKQVYELPLQAPVQRHILLAIDGCIRNLLIVTKAPGVKTFYNKIVSPVLNKGDWFERLELLLRLDYDTAYHPDKPARNLGLYKSLAFDVGQTLSLIKGIELYTKDLVIAAHPELMEVISRQPCDLNATLKQKIAELYNVVKVMDIRQIEAHHVSLGNEVVDTRFGKLLKPLA